MDKYTLKATSPLDGYQRTFGTTRLTEDNSLSIFSIGLGTHSDTAIASIQSAFGTSWPDIGKTSKSEDERYQLLGLQSDQIFMATKVGTALPLLDDSVYTTDQSDSWAALRISGPMAISALERICPLDLHTSSFKAGDVARTSMEHLAIILLCEAQDQYLLLSPTSSAHSFLHALETSLQNVHI